MISFQSIGNIFTICMFRLQELSTSNEENPDLSDIELIQHINVDTNRLIRLLNGKNGTYILSYGINNFILTLSLETISKSKLLRKSVHLVLIASLEKAIWNWMDTYPHEFSEIQVIQRNVIHCFLKILNFAYFN